MYNDTITINNVDIKKDYCSSFDCRIKIKLLTAYVGMSLTDRNISITEHKVYELINEYGISKVIKEDGKDQDHSVNCIVIETPELEYYVDLK